jgi:hypothetical protein
MDNFLQDRNYVIEEIKAPYICTSFFAIRNDVWRNIINDQSLYVDNFDEVPLNKYKDKTNKKMLFITNSFCVHIIYNTIGEVPSAEIPDLRAYERNFGENLKSILLPKINSLNV